MSELENENAVHSNFFFLSESCFHYKAFVTLDRYGEEVALSCKSSSLRFFFIWKENWFLLLLREYCAWLHQFLFLIVWNFYFILSSSLYFVVLLRFLVLPLQVASWSTHTYTKQASSHISLPDMDCERPNDE